jgi:hypothetical protein
MTVRPEIVEQVALALSEPESTASERFRAVGQLEPTTEELRAASDRLAAAAVEALTEVGVVTTVPSLLSFDYRRMVRLGWQGRALLAVADDLAPTWASWPDRPLSTMLKTVAPDRLARITRLLHTVGLHDLCDGHGDDDAPK